MTSMRPSTLRRFLPEGSQSRPIELALLAISALAFGALLALLAVEHYWLRDLKFDDANLRVVFYRADGKEMFTIPYDALVVIYPDSTAGTPQSGKVLSKMPLPGAGLFDLMSKNTVYANLTFDDPDVDANGVAKFRFDNQQQLVDFIHNLGTRAKMLQRGDAYYRPKKAVF